MVDLSRRGDLAEEMDDATLDPAEYARCLHDLASVNRVTLTHRPTLRWFAHATAGLPPGTRVTVLDVACGEGDLLRAMHRRAAARGLDVTLTGVDLNPRSAMVAAAATPADLPIAYVTADIFAFEPAEQPDFIVSSQFAHHLADADVVRFVRWLERHARRGWFIADLHRHAIPYYGFRVLAFLAGWHRIVRTDGTISIARGFRRADWTRLLESAGVDADITWRMPFRFCVSRLA
jgi:2-polyprenyl-3-methyl-5-hydroxy-6-metoxy-1,4-benzoquinol methylase